MYINLISLREVIDKQDEQYISPSLKKQFKQSILAEFRSNAKFVKELFLNFKNLEFGDLQELMPVIIKLR